jgi:LmbE family N-acetylglucosaminyl deacetylase
MAGQPSNDDPDAFWRADIDEAAGRLLAILADEGADLLVTYDERGGYGHPDHLQVHRLGAAVAQGPSRTRVLESTMNRERLLDGRTGSAGEAPDPEGVGMPPDRIHLAVDVLPWLERKRAAMRAHASQISEESFFLAMPQDRFADVFGTEWYIRHGVPDRSTDLVVDGIDLLLAAP